MKTILRISGTLFVCFGGLSACMAMNQPIGDSFGAAVEGNKQAQIINKAPPTAEQPQQSGARAAEAIIRYQAGPQTSTSEAPSESGS